MKRTPRRPAAGTGDDRALQQARSGTLPYDVPSDPAAPIDNTHAHAVHGPVFAQPTATVDPTEFRVRHGSDTQAYKTLDALNTQHALQPLPFPARS